MLHWLIIAGIVILVAVLVLAYFEMADVVVDLVTALLQLAISVVTMTFALLAALLNALRRLLKRRPDGINP